MELNKNEQITEALNWRYAVKAFDTAKKVSEADMHTILESGRLAPSSLGLEPWKFIVVKNPEVRAKLRAVGYNQSGITDASHLVVVVQRTDVTALVPELIERTSKTQGKTAEELAGLRAMAEGVISVYPDPTILHKWLASQTYISLGMMIETAALLGVDACPMEGFESNKVDEILGLPAKNLKCVTMATFGYRGEDSYAALPKTRRSFDEVVEVVA